jgi:hypothetical protein
MSADAMLTPDETWQRLRQGPIYADFDARTPTKVWIVEHAAYAYRALETKPFEGFPGLVWALVEASCVSRSRAGISVDFWQNGATGWFPYGNARLPV